MSIALLIMLPMQEHTHIKHGMAKLSRYKISIVQSPVYNLYAKEHTF
jgi:hypothetical protein